jgi:hypothetical protein
MSQEQQEQKKAKGRIVEELDLVEIAWMTFKDNPVWKETRARMMYRVAPIGPERREELERALEAVWKMGFVMALTAYDAGAITPMGPNQPKGQN